MTLGSLLGRCWAAWVGWSEVRVAWAGRERLQSSVNVCRGGSQRQTWDVSCHGRHAGNHMGATRHFIVPHQTHHSCPPFPSQCMNLHIQIRKRKISAHGCMHCLNTASTCRPPSLAASPGMGGVLQCLAGVGRAHAGGAQHRLLAASLSPTGPGSSCTQRPPVNAPRARVGGGRWKELCGPGSGSATSTACCSGRCRLRLSRRPAALPSTWRLALPCSVPQLDAARSVLGSAGAPVCEQPQWLNAAVPAATM